MKKISAIFFLFLILSGIIFYLYYFQKEKEPVSSAIRAIPSTSEFIIECRQPHQLWEKLSETNLIWNELYSINFMNDLNEQLKFFDSLYVAVPDVKEIFDKQSLFISAHPADEKKTGFLFLFAVPPSVGTKFISELADEISRSEFSKSKKDYDGAEISTFLSAQTAFSFTVYNHIFMGSFNAMLVEDALRQMNAGVSLADDFNFGRTLATAGKNAEVNLYINHKNFPQFISSFTKNFFDEDVSNLRNFADWTALDLRLKPNILTLNGFTFANDSFKKFLNLFEEQKPQQPEFLKIIPYNTSAFLHFGFGNFARFYKQYNMFLDHNERTGKIIQMNAQCQCDIEKKFLSWIENELAIVIPEPSAQEIFLAVFKSKNIAETKKMLNAFSDSAQTSSDTLSHEKFSICKIDFPDVYPVLLGKMFSKIHSNYFIIVDDYVVFGSETATLQNVLSNYLSEKTLGKNLKYRSFSEELSSESNIFIYSNISRSSDFLKEFIHSSYERSIDDNLELFRKFEAFALQLSADDNNFFYNNIILKYNPSSKNETATLWETRLDTTVSFKPVLVVNHYTQAKEIFVQDDANAIYLIGNTGKILWKKQMPEKIMSEIFQIDALNNNKLQLLFNTASSIYLIDRNGKDVHGFPVKLSAEASSPIAVFDYDKNKNYRIILACDDGNVRNYEKTGKAVAGWEFPKLRDNVHLPLQHFSLNGKDFLIAIDENGNIYAVDRSGKTRIHIKEKIHISKNNTFFIETGKDLAKTKIVATDSTGNIIRLYFGGNIENIRIDDFSEEHFFAYQNIQENQSPEYLFADKQKLSVYAQDKIRYSIFDCHFESDITQPPMFFEFPDHSVKTGIADKRTNKIFLFDETGTLQNNFPLYGSAPFSIGNLYKDGALYLVTASGSNIYCYALKL